ncbi:MAG: SPOR domain-containing protein [Alphaproteobacteria bacterium]|nr:SPOR domain-containing protein [Alphaproteobacteria bacterium]
MPVASEEDSSEESSADVADSVTVPEMEPTLKAAEAGTAAISPAEASAKGMPLPRPQNPQKGPEAAPAVAMHEPGASPDTIAFVRDVLGKKDEKTAAAVAAKTHPEIIPEPGKQEIYGDKVASITPAAGTESPAAAAPKIATGGSTYVQVVSVPSRAAAESEWGKLQKSLGSLLSGSPYRIQEANLGDKGTYYRVQVGPFAEADAKSLCSQIKAQKPGGCLVVH